MTAAGPVIATIVARNYIAFARVLATSLRAHHPQLPFVVVVIDAEAAEPLDLAAVGERLSIGVLGIPDLPQTCFSHSCQELAAGVPISRRAREIHRNLGRAAAEFGDPFETARPSSFYAWLEGHHPDAVAGA